MKFNYLFEYLKSKHPQSSIFKDISLIYEQEENANITLPDCNLKEVVTRYNNYPTPTISCAIITFNEERCIYRCIDSLKSEFDEVVILDSFSTDSTTKIVQNNFPHVKIYYEEWKNDFSYTRNKIMEYCNSNWIYYIDADNIYSQKNKGKMRRVIKLIEFLAIECVISPVIKEHNGHIYTGNRKIFKKGVYRFKGKIHEEPFLKNGDIPFNLTAEILVYHDGYDDKLVNQESKNTRNLQYTKNMISIDSENPKWFYFCAKEIHRETGTTDQTILLLEKALYLFKSSDYKRYYPETIIFYCQMLLKANSYSKLQNQVEHLEEIQPNCIDTDYFRAIMIFQHFNIKLSKVVSILENSIFDKTRFSIINSSNEHIYSLISQIYLSLNQPVRSAENLDKIKAEEEKIEIKKKYKEIINYLEEFIT